jgi:hypothetical protein
MLLIKVNYFISFISLLSLAVSQLIPKGYRIINVDYGGVLAVSSPTDGSKVLFEPPNFDDSHLKIWKFEQVHGTDAYNINIYDHDLYLSHNGNEVVLSSKPLGWYLDSFGNDQFELSPMKLSQRGDNLNVDSNSGNPKLNFVKAENSDTQKWIIR